MVVAADYRTICARCVSRAFSTANGLSVKYIWRGMREALQGNTTAGLTHGHTQTIVSASHFDYDVAFVVVDDDFFLLCRRLSSPVGSVGIWCILLFLQVMGVSVCVCAVVRVCVGRAFNNTY